jgi:hypothetical protein
MSAMVNVTGLGVLSRPTRYTDSHDRHVSREFDREGFRNAGEFYYHWHICHAVSNGRSQRWVFMCPEWRR